MSMSQAQELAAQGRYEEALDTCSLCSDQVRGRTLHSRAATPPGYELGILHTVWWRLPTATRRLQS